MPRKTLHLREQANCSLWKSLSGGVKTEIYRICLSYELLKIFIKCMHPYSWKLLGPVLTEQTLFFKNSREVSNNMCYMTATSNLN